MSPDLSSLAPLRLVAPLMGAALLAEALAWGVLAWPGALSAQWMGRPGMLIGAHLLAVGVLALSIIGAGWQLITVVSNRPLGRVTRALAGWIDAAALLGAAGLVLSFWRPGVYGIPAAGLVIGALLTRSLLVVPTILKAPGRRALRGWLLAAEICLWAGLILAAGLYGNRTGHALLTDHFGGIGLHASLLLAGWVGGWILGLGGLLLPMFAVAEEAPGPGMAAAGALYFGGLWTQTPTLWAAGAAAVAALLLYTLHRRVKPSLGAGLALAAWGLIGLTATAGLAASGRYPAAVAAGFAVFALPMLRGVATRILPFLAWAHLFGDAPAGAPPVTALVPEAAAKVVAALTAAGGAAVVAGLALGQEGAASIGAAVLLLAALGHIGVIVEVARRSALKALRRGAVPGMAAGGSDPRAAN